MNINKQTISSALDSASFPVIAALMVHFTGDISILNRLPKPGQAVLGETQGFFNDKEKQIIKKFALNKIEKYFKQPNKKDLYVPSEGELNQMMNYLVGDTISSDYAPMMLQEININRQNNQKLNISNKDDLNIEVLIIGAGMSGILAGIKLAEMGIKFKIYEKNIRAGGTWYENKYPGSRVDIANHFYSYSFEEHNWSEHFSQQPELLDYFEKCFYKYGIDKSTYFEREVISADFDELAGLWSIKSQNHGNYVHEKANIIISCVGQLNQPHIPDISSINDFKGDIFHSSRWPDHDVITDKKVALIGSGASAFQIVPSIAKATKNLTIFQRSPPWMFPNPKYHEEVDEGKKWLLTNLPYYSRWYRFLLFYPGSDQLLDSLLIDPKWHESASINKHNDEMREFFTEAMTSQISDESLIKKVIPKYPPFGKRMLQDNGSWLKALHLPNVNLLTEEAKLMNSKGIIGSDQEMEFDTIILATGFKAQEFFYPMKIDGGYGDFNKMYKDSPKSYLGITFSTMPNFFAMYGPGTNLAHAGSIIFNSECQINYICSAIEYLIKNNLKKIRVKPAIEEKYQNRFDARHQKMVWQHDQVSSWYQNSVGKVVTTSPWKLLEYWNWTKKFNSDDYEF